MQTNIMINANKQELLLKIQSGLVHGDIREVSEETGFTRQYVGLVLSPHNDHYNDEIVEAVVNKIAKREQDRKKILKKLI